MSQSVESENGLVWNPYLKDAPGAVKDLRDAVKKASDHFPVSVEIEV